MLFRSGLDAALADTDADRLDDGAEVTYWGANWSGDIDGDGIVNVLDPDSDNDGAPDGLELIGGSDPADETSTLFVVYEDGADGLTLGWDVYDGDPAGATIANVFDTERQSLVIELSRDASQGFRLRSEDFSPWGNTAQFVLGWRMKLSGYCALYIQVQTSSGMRYLKYTPADGSSLGTGTYVHHGLGGDADDGRWHGMVRDLQADLQAAQPGLTILAVNAFMFRGSGRLDDIRLMHAVWDGDGDGLSDMDEVNTHGTDVALADTDADGIDDGQEIGTYGTDPTQADTDGDGLDDGAELSYWGVNWSIDYDDDGSNNLVDADADNDGVFDAAEVSQGFDPADPAAAPAMVYEDGTDGLTLGWDVYDGDPAGATIANVFDTERQSLVIELSRDASQGFRLRSEDFSPWGNTAQFVLGWRMKLSGYCALYIQVQTSSGMRYLKYTPADGSSLGTGTYVHHGLGGDADDGRWHGMVRDLQADLQAAQPGLTILAVNAFMFRGSGRLDDIRLMHAVWDGDGDGLSDMDEVNTYGTDVALADTDADGIDDGQEVAFWGADWDADNDLDGLINLLDPDSDNDGVLDGYLPATVYEDAQDGLTVGWDVYDGDPAGATIGNMFDTERQSRVIELIRDASQGFRLRNEDLSLWGNTTHILLGWRMKLTGYFAIYVLLDTNAGMRYLQYTPVDGSSLGAGTYLQHGLGGDAGDGQWRSFARDLQADLQAAQPGLTILAVNAFMVRGSGRLDDIRLMDEMWDADGDNLPDFDEINLYGTDTDLADTDVDGINDGDELTYWGSDWNADNDLDGLINLLDPDSDNDGILDGDE